MLADVVIGVAVAGVPEEIGVSWPLSEHSPDQVTVTVWALPLSSVTLTCISLGLVIVWVGMVQVTGVPEPSQKACVLALAISPKVTPPAATRPDTAIPMTIRRDVRINDCLSALLRPPCMTHQIPVYTRDHQARPKKEDLCRLDQFGVQGRGLGRDGRPAELGDRALAARLPHGLGAVRVAEQGVQGLGERLGLA